MQRVIVRDASEVVERFLSKSKDLVPMYDVYIFESCPDWMFDSLAVSHIYYSAHDVDSEPSYSSDSDDE